MSARDVRRTPDGDLVAVDPHEDDHVCDSGWLPDDPLDMADRPRPCPICRPATVERLHRQRATTTTGIPTHWTRARRNL